MRSGGGGIMSEYSKEQICPYCEHEESDERANWNGDDYVYCSWCGKRYYANPKYEFIGFEIEKFCEGCGELESECHCEEAAE